MSYNMLISFLRGLYLASFSDKDFTMVDIPPDNLMILNSLLENTLFSPAHLSSPNDTAPAQKDYERKLIRSFTKEARPDTFEDFLSTVTSDQNFISKQLCSSPQGMGNMFLRSLLHGDLLESDDSSLSMLSEFFPASCITQTAYQRLQNEGVSLCSFLCSFSYIQMTPLSMNPKILASKYNPESRMFEIAEVNQEALEEFMTRFFTWFRSRSDFVSFSDIQTFCKTLAVDENYKGDVFIPISSACADLSYSKNNKPSTVTLNDLKIFVPKSRGLLKNFKPLFTSVNSMKKMLYNSAGLSVPNDLEHISFRSRSVDHSGFASVCDNMKGNIQRRPFYSNRIKKQSLNKKMPVRNSARRKIAPKYPKRKP